MSKIYDYEILKDFIPLLYSTMTMKICAYIARRTDICFYNKNARNVSDVSWNYYSYF